MVSAPLPLVKLNRAERAAERRQAIIEAALDEFIARGFAATRLDDVARRAGTCQATRNMTIALPIDQWRQLGVRLAGGGALPADAADAPIPR